MGGNGRCTEAPRTSVLDTRFLTEADGLVFRYRKEGVSTINVALSFYTSHVFVSPLLSSPHPHIAMPPLHALTPLSLIDFSRVCILRRAPTLHRAISAIIATRLLGTFRYFLGSWVGVVVLWVLVGGHYSVCAVFFENVR